MPDGPEKTAAMKEWQEAYMKSQIGGALRVFVGRGSDNEAAVCLNDTTGKPRIVLSVDGSNTPSLQFLDENGKVIYRIPEAGLNK